MTEQEFTKRLDALKEAAADLLQACKELEYQKTADGVMVQVDRKTGEPVEDQNGYYWAYSQGANPDACGDGLRLYVPVEPWEPEENEEELGDGSWVIGLRGIRGGVVLERVRKP